MDMFTHLSRFALSWAMAGMAIFFVAVIVWVFRPGSRKDYDTAASSIFRHDSRPADGDPPRANAARGKKPSAAKGA